MIRVRNHPSERKNRKSRGQGMVEFALALPIFLLLVLGVIEFGRLLAVVSSVTTAAREGARYGSAAGVVSGDTSYFQDCQGMRAAAERVGFFAGVQDANVAIGYFDTDSRANVPDPSNTGVYPAAKQCAGTTSSYLYDPNKSPRVVVKVSVTFKFLFLGLPAFPITSQSARTIVTQIEMDVTPGTITPAPPKTATSTVTGTPPTPTNTATSTDIPTLTLTPSETPTVTGTPPTPTSTSTETLTPTATSTATPLPVCGFLHVGAGVINGTYEDYNFYVYNNSGGASLYPAQDVWVRAVSISWKPASTNVSLLKINFSGVAVYTADPPDSSPKSVGFGDGNALTLIGANSSVPLDFIFSNTNGQKIDITNASMTIQYKVGNSFIDCPLNPYKPNPLMQ